MNLVKLSTLLVAASLATGCISLFEEQKQEAEVKNREAGLTVPPGLNDPIKSQEYKLYPSQEREYSQILAPTSVLVMLEGSWVDDEDKHPAKIMVEKPALVDNLPQFIDRGIESYFKLNGITPVKTDKGYRFTRTWAVESGFWFWTTEAEVEQAEFDVVVDMKPHGRSGSVAVDIVDYKVLDEGLAPDVSPSQRSASLAVQALNDIMLEVDYQYRIRVKNEIESVDISLELVKNIAGNYVISSQQDIKYVWSQTEDIIEEFGFDVVEEDESLYVMDTVFSKSGSSGWNIFGSDLAKKLNIPEGEYEVTLSTSIKGVDIAFRSKENGYLNQAQMENLFELFLQVAKEEEAEL